MRKFLIYIICGLMTLAMFLPSIVKAADTNANETEEKVYGVEFKLIKSNGSTQYIGLLNNYVSLSNPEMPTLKEDFLNLFNSTSTKTFNPRIQRFYTFGHAYDIECYKVRTIHAEPFQDLSDIKELKSSYLGEYDRNLVIWVYAKLKTGFKVYFDPKNGKEIFKTEATFASKVKESPENPTREGYKFLGWYEGDKEFDLKKSNIYEDTTLTAKWEKINHEKYTVKFVLKGKDIPSQEVEFDSQAKEPTIEAIEGFEFDGWYTDSKFTKKFNFSSPVKSNLNLYARWKKKKYTVSFMIEGENIPNQEVEFDSQAKEPTIEAKEGLEFDGWYTDKEFNNKFNFSDPIKNELSLYARWNKKKYTVSFVLEGKDIPSQEVEFNSQASKPKVDPKDGFEFDGWYTDPGFTSKFDFSSPVQSDLNLYARWEKKKYNVSFVLEGEEISNQNVEFDSQATEPTVETKEGFEFDGWYTDSGFTSKFNFSSPIKSDMNLYARWNKIEEEKPNPDDNKDPDETEEPGKNPDQNPGEDQEPGDDKDTDENPDEDKDPDESEEPGNNPDEKEKPGETEQPDDDEKENPDEDKKPDDNKESDDQKNPDIKDKPNNNDRPSYDYDYDYYDYYRYPNYDYLNSNRNNSSDIAKNKNDNKGDKAEEKTKDENKEEIIEEKVTIPEAILNSYFSDIGDLPGHYQEAIIDLANRSVLIGTGKNNFDPHTSISRAMVAQVLYRLANDKAYVNPSDFTDSAPTNWFYTAVNWANEKGLVKGFKDKTFKPNKSITNEELAVILARAIEKLELKTSNINSINKDNYKFLADWNRDGIIKMLELGLMDFSFEGNQVVVKEISRAEFANIIYKLINSLN